LTREEIKWHIKQAEEVAKKDREKASTLENGISTTDLAALLSKAQIVCCGRILHCTEIRCVGKDGSVWHPINFYSGVDFI
jgi:hypothetical protein